MRRPKFITLVYYVTVKIGQYEKVSINICKNILN